jgi:hypothetical protein
LRGPVGLDVFSFRFCCAYRAAFRRTVDHLSGSPRHSSLPPNLIFCAVQTMRGHGGN